MAGPGTPMPIEPLQVGIVQPPTVQPALTGDAVDRLANAVHNGFINTSDIIDRIGAVGQAKKQATLQSLSEYVSPEAIHSRMAALKSQGAMSELQTQHAAAESGLLPEQTSLESQAI